MPHADFVHLAVHSAYSLSEGAMPVKKLVERAKAEAMPALGIADTANLFGSLEFAMACADAGVQPVIGCRLLIRRADLGPRGVRAEPDRLTLIARSETGWLNLMRLVSRGFLDGEAGEHAVPFELVEQHHDGLIALTGGGKGVVDRMLRDGQAEAAEAVLRRLASAFGDRLYVELGRHGMDGEAAIEAALLDLAYRHSLPLVAVNEAFFADSKMYEAHDALLCIAANRVVAESDRPRLTPEYRFKSAREMRLLFGDLPEACDNTLVIARRCSFMPRMRKPILPAPPAARQGSAEDSLRLAAEQGLEGRLAAQVFASDMDEAAREAAAKPYRERLAFELDVIAKMGFAGYFLIVADFIQWAKRQQIPVGPGRGSGAGSVVAWALTITDLDPLRFGLLFERFLNPERVSMPDFDIDFCQERRDEVIRYVAEQYGHDRVAQIITFGKLQARAVLRNVGRVLGMPYGQVDRICKLMPFNPAKPVTLKEAIAGDVQLQDMRDNDERVARLMEIGMALEGLYRNASTHAAGVVIGDRPLEELVPLYRDPRATMPATQYNLKYVELAGLVKFDFLGLKTLTVLDLAVKLLARRDITLDLLDLPLDDPPTYELLSRAETVGIFQFESAGMRDAMRKLRPDQFEDLIALGALYRPGPMENIPRYIACKHGQEQPDYMHPKLEPILKETFGVIIYQEQVMEIARVLSGYTLGGADLLRRAMGKKIKAEMDAQRAVFVKGAIERGVSQADATHVFDLVDKFAGYGFNKSHAAAYALVAYQTAYLKANYPVEFIAASMSFDLDRTEKLNVFRQELDRLKIPLLPPDINRSEGRFSVEFGEKTPRGAVRYALAALKGVGMAAMDELVRERTANGPFRSLTNFARRLDPRHVNRAQLESLVKAGAFDTLEPNRARAFGAVEAMLKLAQRSATDRETNQSSLFGAGADADELRLAKTTDWPSLERLANEMQAIGFYLSAHPLDAYAKGLARLGAIRSSDLAARLSAGGAARVKLAGTVIGKQERTTSKGTRMAFLQLSDAGGMYEVTLFAETLGQARELIGSGRPLLITANARLEEESIRLVADAIQPLDDAVANASAGLRVVINDLTCVEGLRKTIAGERRGRGRVSIVAELGEERQVEIALKDSFAVSPATRSVLQNLPGVLVVEEV
jgi:DNA polymerase-3 subunit alpha